METLEQIKNRVLEALPGVRLEVVPNDSPANQPSLAVHPEDMLKVAVFVKESLGFDYVSNVTGVDWLDAVIKEKRKVKKTVEGVEKEVDETVERKKPGYLEAVYHLYSMRGKTGPLILRMRTGDRTEQVHLPSLTPIWRGAELQEREIYDLYGIVFDGHPDLRRILMWDGFKDHPMRKDYEPPDDFEYEPTPHDDVLAKAREHYPEAMKK